MGFGLHMLAYPWDLADGGAEELIGRLRGEVGIDGLSVWAVTPPVVQINAGRSAAAMFSTPGGAFFLPRESMFARTTIRPVVSTWVRSRDPLEEARQLCERHGLALRVVVSVSRAGRMAERYPQVACRNALGGDSNMAICPLHPEVQAYLTALVGNLHAAYAPQAIVMTDFGPCWPDASSPAFRAPVALDSASREAMSVCFCDACMHAAKAQSADADRARGVAVEIATGLWRDGAGSRPARGPLDAYLRAQREGLKEIAGKLVAASGHTLIFDQGDEPAAPSLGVEMHALSSADQLSELADSAGARWEIRIGADWAIGEKGPALVGLLADAARRGALAATIDHLGLLPESAYKVLKQAARFARRTSEPAPAA